MPPFHRVLSGRLITVYVFMARFYKETNRLIFNGYYMGKINSNSMQGQAFNLPMHGSLGHPPPPFSPLKIQNPETKSVEFVNMWVRITYKIHTKNELTMTMIPRCIERKYEVKEAGWSTN